MPCQIRDTDLTYFPVPKAACTSVKFAILNHNEHGLADRLPGRMASGQPVRNVHEAYPSTPFNPIRHGLKHAGRRWFCVVRDPVSRLLSAYANRIVFHDDLKHSDPDALEAAGLPRHPSLDEFVDRLDQYAELNLSVGHHVAPMHQFLGRRPGRFDRIFTLSELPALAAYCAAAGASLAIPHQQTGGAKVRSADVDGALIARIRDHYRLDYELYGHVFEALRDTG